MGLSKSNIDYLPRLNGKDGYVWNVAVGGEPAYGSPGEMEALAKRIGRNIGCKLCESFTPHVHAERFGDVTPRQKPKRIGVGFMTDLFGVDEWTAVGAKRAPQDALLDLCSIGLAETLLRLYRACPQHRFIIPTRFPENIPTDIEWPENVCISVTCTNQDEANRNLPVALERIKGEALVAANLEPLRAAVPTLECCFSGEWLIHCVPGVQRAVSWVIAGGMSGPLATPMHPDWVRGLRDQCVEAGVPFYFKQWGAWAPQIYGHPAWKGRQWGTLDRDGNWYPETTPWNGRQGDASATAEYVMVRVGKKVAGHLLDGREWRQMPEALLLPGERPDGIHHNATTRTTDNGASQG